MRDKLQFLKDILSVIIGNIASLVSGVLIGFALPKIISVEGYGYYKTFSLYGPYLALCSLGLIDGIVLKYGAKDYEQLEKEKFRSFFRWHLIIHLFFTFLVCCVTLLTLEGDYLFIGITLAINNFATNTIGYFQDISQITMRFKEYSLRKIIQSLCNTVAIAVLYILFIINDDVIYKTYIIEIIILNYIIMMWYIKTYSNIVFGKHVSFADSKKECIGFIKQGFPLLFSYQIATLILSMDRQFVSILFPTTVYAVYAFAYSMLQLVTTATSAISAVCFPMLKRMKIDDLKLRYHELISIFLGVVFFVIIIYFPLEIFVRWFLPKYNDSLIIFRIILPGTAISSSITVIMHNYYKVLGKSFSYFKKSLIVLGASAVTNGIAYILYRSTIAISWASILTMIFWYLFIERYLLKECQSKSKKNFIYIIIMSIIFYAITGALNTYIGLLIYILSYIACTYIFYRKEIKKYMNSFRNN